MAFFLNCRLAKLSDLQSAVVLNHQKVLRIAMKGKVQTVRVENKIGRNDPCPCGSGKKYKQCHGKS